MGNLNGKFRVTYLNFYGIINQKKGNIVYSDILEFEYEIIKKISISELQEIFDPFYGGQMYEKNDKIILNNIPVRILYFETEGTRKIIGIGHVQKDSWICKSQNKVVTEEVVTKEYVDIYLENIMREFPRSLNKFLHIFENNPYEMCDVLNLKDTDPLDISEIFRQTFIRMSESKN